MSGGPTINTQGQVIDVNAASLNSLLYFIIPINQVIDLKKKGLLSFKKNFKDSREIVSSKNNRKRYLIRSSGSGFLINTNELIIINHHVIEKNYTKIVEVNVNPLFPFQALLFY
jgi:S1-C subfamily serine protease